MSAFKEALEHLAGIEDAEERGLQAALLDSQIEEATKDNDFTEQERAEWEQTKEVNAKMKEELSDLKVKYANLYFAGADDNKLPKSYNEPKPTTLKDILG